MNTRRSIATSEAAKARLSQLLATMREVFWIAPSNPQESLLVNSSYERVFGNCPSDLDQRRWFWLRSVAKADRRKLLELIRDVRSGVDREDLEVRIRHSDGDWRWVQCRMTRMDDPELGSSAIMGLALEVTARKRLQNRILEVAEEERQRVGMELHDDLCQRLAGLRLKVGVLTSSISASDTKATELAFRVAEELSEAVSVARLFARGLAPVQLDRLGLHHALGELAETVKRSFGIECRLDLPEVERDLESGISSHVFRAIQELAVNAAKHSRPEWIEITMRDEAGKVSIRVSHNGAPFKAEESSQTGMGLHLLQQRLDALGASIRRGRRMMNDGQQVVTAAFGFDL